MPEYVKRLRELVGPDEILQIPSVSIALRDQHGRVLLARHVEGDQWVLPGGAIEPGEVPKDAAIREMREETGIEVRLTGWSKCSAGLSSSSLSQRPPHVLRDGGVWSDCAG